MSHTSLFKGRFLSIYVTTNYLKDGIRQEIIVLVSSFNWTNWDFYFFFWLIELCKPSIYFIIIGDFFTKNWSLEKLMVHFRITHTSVYVDISMLEKCQSKKYSLMIDLIKTLHKFFTSTSCFRSKKCQMAKGFSIKIADSWLFFVLKIFQ